MIEEGLISIPYAGLEYVQLPLCAEGIPCEFPCELALYRDLCESQTPQETQRSNRQIHPVASYKKPDSLI